jgi:spermidine/putrescine transport system ATP-binding protein
LISPVFGIDSSEHIGSLWLYLANRRGNSHPSDPRVSGQDVFAPPSTRAPLPASNAIELRGLSVRYKTLVALNDIDLEIRRGEFFSLLGPSGCGKTTTLNIIGGFIEPDEGEVLIDGKVVNRSPPYRRPVNTVFQSYALFPHMTVAQNVGFGLRMAGVRAGEIEQRTREALQLVSLADFGSRRPDQLSGGQQQRVALARALVNRPSVLLLDEPLGALDLKLRKQMQSELTRIQREVGITFIYVTHDQDEAMTMSDRIAVMNRGRVAQVGTPQEIYERPSSLFVADFIGASNVFSGRVIGAAGPWCLVRLDIGRDVRVPASTAPEHGSKAWVVVRPDHMSLADALPEMPDVNAIAGAIKKVSFLGTHLQFAIATPQGEEITVVDSLSSPERKSVKPIMHGEVCITWPASASLCFRDDEAEAPVPRSLARS